MLHIFPIALVKSCSLAASNAIRVVCCRLSTRLQDPLCATSRLQWRLSCLLFSSPLFFAIGCGSYPSNVGPSVAIELMQVPHAAAGGPFWLRIVCAGAFCLIVAALCRFRMFRLRRQLNIRFQERLAERTRIAQELHDTLLQSFQGLILRFQMAYETVLSDPADAKECLERALDRADQVIAESRKVIQGIRSISSAGHDLTNSLNAMINGLIEETCVGKPSAPNTSVVAEGQSRPVNPWIAEEVCKVAKEALWNAVFHARPGHIEFEIKYSHQYLRLRFRDDGIGFDSPTLKHGGGAGHWGITGMHERARNVHGRLSIWSRPGAGTEVELTIPGYIAYDTAPSRGL